jgi:hypothetical protein
MTFRPATILMFIAGATLACAAPALAKVKGPRPVVLQGCPFAGVPSLCTEMKGPHGAVFNVTAAAPPAPVGKFIILQGTPSDAHSFCQGTPLQNISWKETKRRCPPSKQ